MKKKSLGIAIDLGTTEIKGSLFDLGSKKRLKETSVANEQRGFGQDVITRLQFAITKEYGLEELNKRTISAINKLIGNLTIRRHIRRELIDKIIAVGNSAMYHIVMMIKPDELARAPFLPAEKAWRVKSANEMGICAGKNAQFKILPNISGFLGSDTLAVILSTKTYKKNKFSVIMDIGTNGEIVLASKQKIFAASCASGPAFEGRHIRSGMPAIDGAINKIDEINGRIKLHTVNNKEPKGIAGSALIDILALLKKRKIMDKTGRISRKEFVIYEKGAKKISISQDDIRQAQLAKGALSAGVEVLIKRSGVGIKKIDGFYITGAFGKSINKVNASVIGLIPKGMPLSKVKFVKNGALSGAEEVLLDSKKEKEVDKILNKCLHVELHKDPLFQEAFASNMHF